MVRLHEVPSHGRVVSLRRLCVGRKGRWMAGMAEVCRMVNLRMDLVKIEMAEAETQMQMVLSWLSRVFEQEERARSAPTSSETPSQRQT